MTNLDTKISAFEYMLNSLYEWYKEFPELEGGIESFSRIKSLKLLFLVASVNASAEKDSLLSTFNNFYAMQHGPVESDIYNAMTTNQTRFFDFSSKETKINNQNLNFDTLNQSIKNEINSSIASLRMKNPNIVTYSSFELVDITHKWESWKMAIELAQIFDKGSELMSTDDIKNDTKYFS